VPGLPGLLINEATLIQTSPSFGRSDLPGLDPVLDKAQLAELLAVPPTWVASNAESIPGMFRLGRYLRFRSAAIEGWLGGNAPLLKPEEVSHLLSVPTSWVYSHAVQIPGVLRLGYYIRFRRAAMEAFLGGSETCQ
jgi:predicted DNA-binding transcriptional regulator AlpA